MKAYRFHIESQGGAIACRGGDNSPDHKNEYPADGENTLSFEGRIWREG
jgi:hypothetical protein